MKKKKKKEKKNVTHFRFQPIRFLELHDVAPWKGAKIFFFSILSTRGEGGGRARRGVLLEPAPILKIYNFQTVKAMTTKFGDFS